jgi:hypothetical protein
MISLHHQNALGALVSYSLEIASKSFVRLGHQVLALPQLICLEKVTVAR